MIHRVSRGMPLTKNERRAEIERLFTEVVLPQRRRLLSMREHTLISTGGSSGNLGEMVAALVTGIRGNERKGKTAAGNTGDLSDGTEVKAYTVCETNIDFLVHGTLHRLPNAVVFGFSRDEELTTIDMRDIRNQINSVSSNLLQVLQEHDGRWIGSQHLYRTSTNALRRIDDGGLGVGITHEQLQQLCRDNGLRVSGSKAVLRERLLAADVDGVPNLEDGLYLVMRSETEGHENEHFSYDESLFNGEHYWSFRKERSHINFGGKTREQLREILEGKGIGVCNFMDPRGRYTFAVFRFELENDEIEAYLEQVDFNPTSQVQPYLFDDNVRTQIKGGEGHTLERLGARLMMLGHEVAGGAFSVVHMETENPPTLDGDVEDGRSVVEALTGFANPDECPSVEWDATELDWDDDEARIEAADEFFHSCIVGFYRSMTPFCDLAGSPRNIGFGTYGEHLASLVTGLTGTRSNARGVDLYEEDGSASDVKTAVGFRGDNMGTEDAAVRYNLMKDQAKLYGWKRWFPVRMTDEVRQIGDHERPQFRASIFQLDTDGVKSFHDQIHEFFQQDRANLQYHTSPNIRDDTFGPQDRRLQFSEMAHFAEGEAFEFSQSLHDIVPDHRNQFLQYCRCEACRN